MPLLESYSYAQVVSMEIIMSLSYTHTSESVSLLQGLQTLKQRNLSGNPQTYWPK